MTTKFKRKMPSSNKLMTFLFSIPVIVILILVAYVLSYLFT